MSEGGSRTTTSHRDRSYMHRAQRRDWRCDARRRQLLSRASSPVRQATTSRLTLRRSSDATCAQSAAPYTQALASDLHPSDVAGISLRTTRWASSKTRSRSTSTGAPHPAASQLQPRTRLTRSRACRPRSLEGVKFAIVDDLDPIVNVQECFDDLLIPEDHPGRGCPSLAPSC